MQCSPNYPHLKDENERINHGVRFRPGCYNYHCATEIKPLITLHIPDHAHCRLLCGTIPRSNLVGFRDGKKCSCFAREDFTFQYNRNHSRCEYNCLGNEHQSCGGYRKAYLTTPIFPELPNCFSREREPLHNATLGRDAYVSDPFNTQQKCREACSKMEYPFAEVWGMVNCWCSTNFFGAQMVPEPYCELPCPGNLKQKCGGFIYAWVMKSAPVVDVTCLKDQRGVTYRGSLTVSAEFQQPCKQWSDMIAEVRELPSYEIWEKVYQNWMNGFDKMSPEDQNSTYCRNIDNDQKGPWCFAQIKKGYLGQYKKHCYIPICPSEVRGSTTSEPCTQHRIGKDYLGSKSTTYKGERCMSWSHPDVVRKLHETSIGEDGFNRMTMIEKRSNLCRNPDSRPNGPWCYIDGRFPNWDYCGIEKCNNEKNPGCKVDVKGLSYYGDIDYAKTGQRCRVWGTPDVQRHMSTSKRLMASYNMWPRAVQFSNLCRNPDHYEGGPWCYIEDEDVLSWRVCDIKICNETSLGCKVDVKGLGYNGKVNYAKTGEECRIWGSPEVQMHMSKRKRLKDSYRKWSKAVRFSNFCRNPDGEKNGPWCYIEGEDVPSWRFCNIKICDDSDHTEAFGGVSHGDQLKPTTQMPIYSLAGIIVFWKL